MIIATFEMEMEDTSQVLTSWIGDKPDPLLIEASTKSDDDSETLPSTLSPVYVNEEVSIHPESTQSQDGLDDLIHLSFDPQGPNVTPQTENLSSRRKKLTSFFLFYVLLQFVDIGSDLFACINYITFENPRMASIGLNPVYFGITIIGVIFLPYMGIILLQIFLCCRGKQNSLMKSIFLELPFVNILRNLKNFFHLTKMDLNSDRNEVKRINEEAFNSAIFEAYLESAIQITIQLIAGVKVFSLDYDERISLPNSELNYTYIKFLGPILVSIVFLSVSSTKIFFSKRINNKFNDQDQAMSYMSFSVFLLLLFRNLLYITAYLIQIVLLLVKDKLTFFLYPFTTIVLIPLIILFYNKIFGVKIDLLFIVFSSVTGWICPLLGVDTNKHQKYLSFLLTFISNVIMISYCFLSYIRVGSVAFILLMAITSLCTMNVIIITPILLFISNHFQPSFTEIMQRFSL